jgi:hypothetical protein
MAASFKQARGSSALISGTLPREKALHIATMLGIKILKFLIAGLIVSSSDSVLYTPVSGECKSVYSSIGRMDKGSYSKLLRVTNSKIFIMLMRLCCSSGFDLVIQ